MTDVRADASSMQRFANRLTNRAAKNVRFITAYALTQAALEVRESEKDVMRDVFDRPTRYTLESLQVVPATKDSLAAFVRPKEFANTPAWKFLGPEVQGGPRRVKRFERALQAAGIMKRDEFAVPGEGIALDAFGNVPGGLITRILSVLRANPDAHQNVTAKSKKKRPNRNLDYFVVRGSSHGPDGIYLRVGRRAVPQLIFVKRAAYRRRFPYYETAGRTFAAAFQRNYRERLQRDMAEQPR